MPRYHFIVHNGSRVPDPDGTILPDDNAALAFGKQVIRELMHGDPSQYEGWFMEITESERTIASIGFDLDIIKDRRSG
jgi:hypothetical protein